MDFGDALKVLFVTFVASVLLIVLGLVYFGITLWIISSASNIFFGPGLEANWAVLSAALLSSAAIVAGSLEKKHFKK